MIVSDYLHLAAGLFILLGIALGLWVTPWAFAIPAFVGLNLLQSAFTKWCPLMTVLKKFDVPECRPTS